MEIKFVIIIFCLAIFGCQTSNKKAEGEGKAKEVVLFNGENLDNWKGDFKIWSVENGCIVGRTSDENKIKQNTFLIYKTSFSNFELTFEYKIIGGNSGVQYRSKVIDETLFVVRGYQADMEAGINYSGILYEEKGRGIIANRGKQVILSENGEKSVTQFVKSEEIQAIINKEQWNSYRIIANGNQLQHFINDNKTIDVLDNEKGKNSLSGVIALQVHAGPNMEVFYKNIILRPIID